MLAAELSGWAMSFGPAVRALSADQFIGTVCQVFRKKTMGSFQQGKVLAPQGNANAMLAADGLHENFNVFQTVFSTGLQQDGKARKAESLVEGIGPFAGGGEESVRRGLNNVAPNFSR